MSSLFHDGCGVDAKHVKSKCKGCVCDQLMDLLKCNTFTNQQFLIILKGDNEPVSLVEAGVATVFTFAGFNPENCCARFTYLDLEGTMQTFVIDCRSIAGLAATTDGGL